jgi:hypothetical protein
MPPILVDLLLYFDSITFVIFKPTARCRDLFVRGSTADVMSASMCLLLTKEHIANNSTISKQVWHGFVPPS